MKTRYLLIPVTLFLGLGTLIDAVADVTQVSTRYRHTCVLTEGGTAKCFGVNGAGQLGDGTMARVEIPISRVPVNVIDPDDPSGLLTGLVDISAGGRAELQSHSCAVKASGQAYCWGWSGYGQLGNLAVDFDQSPIAVPVEDAAWPKLDVDAGAIVTCTVVDLLSDSMTGAQCWGFGTALGDGVGEDSVMPVDVINLADDVILVVGGATSSCALMDSGGVTCWGMNDWGQLGDGTNVTSLTPVEVIDPYDPTGLLGDVVFLDENKSTVCAVIADGNVMCWGNNHKGKLGDQTEDDSSIPVSVIDFSDPTELLSGVVEVGVGMYHVCAVIEGGGIKCWGDNSQGQLGDGTLDDRNYPSDVLGLPAGLAAISVSAGAYHSCALMEDGEVWCWGENLFVPEGGELDVYPYPVHVPMDSTPPVIVPHVSGDLGNNGWYVGDVTVSFEVTDSDSDITWTDGCGTVLVDEETTAWTTTCSAASSGGTNSETVTLKRDATPPTVVGAAAPPPNAHGWNDTTVVVSFTGTDATSGIALCTPNRVLSEEGVGLSATGGCFDLAGNYSESVTVDGINIDKTPPVAAVTGVEQAAEYILGAVPTPGCETTDALSGVLTKARLMVTGGNSDGTGTFTATCAGGLDYAENTHAPVSVTFVVISPQVATVDVIDEVVELYDLDVLNAGLTEALVVKLKLVIKAIEDGRNPRIVLNLLNAFINQVTSLMDEGVLTAAEGQVLIDQAQAIMVAIS